MKKLLFTALLLVGVLSARAQSDNSDQSNARESNQAQGQDITMTATLKNASRLFKLRYDLSSVIMLIPEGAVVEVLDSDSTYLHVSYQDNDGYIYRKQAVINKTPVDINSNQPAIDTQSVQSQADDRYTALETKYGTAMAARIYAGKIWKGMNSDMVRDSWGTPEKVNRTVSGNTIKEEWIYRSTWLYFENNTLLQWGPVKK